MKNHNHSTAALGDLSDMRVSIDDWVYLDDRDPPYPIAIAMRAPPSINPQKSIVLNICGDSRPKKMRDLTSAYVPDGREAVESNPDDYEIQFCEDPLNIKETMAFILKRGQTASWSDVTRISEVGA